MRLCSVHQREKANAVGSLSLRLLDTSELAEHFDACGFIACGQFLALAGTADMRLSGFFGSQYLAVSRDTRT